MQDPVQLKRERHEMFAVLLALGLNDARAGAVIFHQDQVPEHAELAWYFNCVTSVNRLMRMTSWKVIRNQLWQTKYKLTSEASHFSQSWLLCATPTLKTRSTTPCCNSDCWHILSCRRRTFSFTSQSLSLRGKRLPILIEGTPICTERRMCP